MSGELVRIGIPREQADARRRIRNVQQYIAQGDAAIARITASVEEKIRREMSGEADAEPAAPVAAVS